MATTVPEPVVEEHEPSVAEHERTFRAFTKGMTIFGAHVLVILGLLAAFTL